MALVIDPAAIETVRTSVRRLLAERGSGPLPFSLPDQLIQGWRAAVKICGDDLALRIAAELPVGSFGRTSYAFASARSLGDALEVFCRDTQRAIAGLVWMDETSGLAVTDSTIQFTVPDVHGSGTLAVGARLLLPIRTCTAPYSCGAWQAPKISEDVSFQ